MRSNYLDELNDVQRQAVEATEGPVMVIAGAGSGKTRVLTYRIAHLINQGVDSFNILALTFTNKAAREMKERIAKVVGASEAKNIWMGTFHSIFARILRVEAPLLGYPANFTIYDQQDALSILKKVIKEMNLDPDVYKPKQILNRISQFKNNLITVRAYFNNPEIMEADAVALRPQTGEIYKRYVEKCFKSGGMDFDDLLLRTNEVLTRFPEVLAKYQNRFRYILVDEYQDTNHSQYLIVKALASRFENICVVGDDAQSIYAFRGANIRNILNFNKDYKDAQSFALEQNYRSTQNIVNAANDIIAKNRDQLKKNVWTSNDAGAKIPVYRALTDMDEARYIAAQIFEKKMQNQYNNSDFAVLYRTNAQSRAIEEALRKKNIPYRIYGGMSFYQRKEVKDLIAYLRLLVNPNDEEALMRIINYPVRGIGNTTQQALTVFADKVGKPVIEILFNLQFYAPQLKLNARAFNSLNNFATMIQSFAVKLKTGDVYEVALQVAKESGILKTLSDDDTPEGRSRLENLQELLNSLQGYVEEQSQIEGGNPTLQGFLEDAALSTDADKDETDTDKVSLMTVHLAKGLEFPVVFIVGLEENLFPSQMNLNSRQELEEERRLFYVALTRAEKEALLSYSVSRSRWGKIVDAEPSRFLEEISDQYLDWKNPSPVTPMNSTGLSADLFGDDFPTFTRKEKNEPISYKRKIKKALPSTSNQNLKKLSEAKLQAGDSANQSLKVDSVVLHDRFGRGVVKSIEGEVGDEKAIVNFENAGEKKLLLRFAKLRIVG
uniref:ATP-dependent helicase n=1 Tax=Ornithobacterium rhinotracheale TaxID=28251 RepID=UPI0039A75ABE